MSVRTFVTTVDLPVSAAEAYDWHSRRGALERLTPAWAGASIVRSAAGIVDGATAVLRVRCGPISLRWTARHRDVEPGRRFVDEQVEGPFARWTHAHEFHPASAGACRIEDRIEYALRGGSVGRVLGAGSVERRLGALFAWRHARLRADLDRHRHAGLRVPSRIAVSGASGLIGGALVPFLRTGGHDVTTLVRRAANPSASELAWDPSGGSFDARELAGYDAVVHLGGRGIAAGRWTQRAKDEILRSRVEPTRRLASGLAALDEPPPTLICASAIGYYGDRGEAEVDENATPGTGFLAEVTQAWEAACEPAARCGIRVVHLRFGVVLSAGGGALARMLPPFRWGFGGRVGSGKQWMSWISLDDALGAILFALARPALSGPVNVVAPEPVRNLEFARALGRVLRRPAIAPLPAAVVAALFGEMGRELLLAGQRVRPAQLIDHGFDFAYPAIDGAMRFELGRLA